MEKLEDSDRKRKNGAQENVDSVPVIPPNPRKTFAEARLERASRTMSGDSQGQIGAGGIEEDETQKKIAALRESILAQSAERTAPAKTMEREEGEGEETKPTRKGRLSTIHTPEAEAITTAMEREVEKRFTDSELYEAMRQVVRGKQIPDELMMAVALEFARDASNTEANRSGDLKRLVAKDTGYRFQLNVFMDALANAMGKELVERVEIDESRREALKNGGLFGRLARAIKGDNAMRTQLEKKFAQTAAEVNALEEIKADLERKIKLLEEEERKEREKTRKAQEDALAQLKQETDKILAFAVNERDEARKAKDEAIAQATTTATAITDNAGTEAKEIIARAQAKRDSITREGELKQAEIDRLVIRLEELKQTERELSQSHEGATAELTRLKKTKEMIGLELEKLQTPDASSLREYRFGRTISRIQSILADPYQVQTFESPSPILLEQWQKQHEAYEARRKEFPKNTLPLSLPDIPPALEAKWSELVQSLETIFGKDNMEPVFLPPREAINLDYMKMAYPPVQRTEDTARGLISYRPTWWDANNQAGILSDLQKYTDPFTLIFTESIPKPMYNGGKQMYPNDPLLPILKQLFNTESRYNHKATDLQSKLLPLLNAKLKEELTKHNISISAEVILTPNPVFNLQTTLLHPENSQTNTFEWSSTPYGTNNLQLSGFSASGGASYAGGGGPSDSNAGGGFRLSVVLKLR